MKHDIHRAVRAVCLWLPESEEYVSHGSPNFRVRGKTYASYVINHHGDGRVALWLNAAPGAQELYVSADPGRFFVPPYLEAPSKGLSPEEIDPLRSARGKAVLKIVRSVCLPLPETREVVQFGFPVWQAGRKTYLWTRCDERRISVSVWVGVDAQGLLTADARYRVPAYMGHNGWIALDVTDHCDTAEVTSLALQSYRHFALKRMLARLAP